MTRTWTGMLMTTMAVSALFVVRTGCDARSSHHPAKYADPTCRCEYRTPSKALFCQEDLNVEARKYCFRNPSVWAVVPEGQDQKDQVSVSAGDVETLRLSWGKHSKAFHLNLLVDYISVRYLSLVGNNVHRMDGGNTSLPSVVHLDLSHNQLRNVTYKLLSAFPNLTSLNVSYNNLTQLSSDVFHRNPHFKSISLMSNNWKCLNMVWLRDAVREGKLVLEDSQQTLCRYFYDAATPTLLMESCPVNCSCFPGRFKLTVNCSGSGYQSFPLRIPPDTILLHLENNNISNLSSLLDMYNKVKKREKAKEKRGRCVELSPNTTNCTQQEMDKAAIVAYQQLKSLYLDNNSLTCLNELENLTGLFENLTSLTVTGNQLSQIPVLVVQQMFFGNLNFVKLGGNPWDCQCNFTVKLIRMLKESGKVDDAALLKCSERDPRNPGKAILGLLEVDLCYNEEFGVNPLDVLNVCLGLIILLCVLKLAYDWWQMKQTGKLPPGPYTVCSWFKCRRK